VSRGQFGLTHHIAHGGRLAIAAGTDGEVHKMTKSE